MKVGDHRFGHRSQNASLTSDSENSTNSASQEVLERQDLVIEQSKIQLKFDTFDCKQINTPSFVDLCSVDNDYHDLGMMAMIQKGELYVLSGSNKTLMGGIKDIKHPKDFNEHALAKVATEKFIFHELWVNREHKLCVSYRDSNSAIQKQAQLDLIPEITGESFLTESLNPSVTLRLTPMPYEQDKAQLTLANQIASVAIYDDESSLIVKQTIAGEPKSVRVKLPIEADEIVTNIKTCGQLLQVSTLRAGRKAQVYYLDARHLNKVTPESFPIMTDEPPTAFSHFAVNNSHSFFSANPYVSCKLKNIQVPNIPISGLLEGIKHRIVAGSEKFKRHRIGAGLSSFAKTFDPGLITVGRFFTQILTRFTANHLNQHVLAPLNKAIVTENICSNAWNQQLNSSLFGPQNQSAHHTTEQHIKDSLKAHGSAMSFSAMTPLLLTDEASTQGQNQTLTNPQLLSNEPADTQKSLQQTSNAQPSIAKKPDQITTAKDELLEQLQQQIKTSYHGLTSVGTLFDQPFYNSTDGQKFLKEWILMDKKLTSILSHPEFVKKFGGSTEQASLKSMKALVAKCLTYGPGILTYKDVELLFPQMSQTLFNVQAYLSINPQEQELYHLLKQKVLADSQGKLIENVKQNLLSVKAVKAAKKSHLALADSLNDDHIGLGKIWMQCHDKIHPSERILNELATKAAKLPEGDSITLSSSEGLTASSTNLANKISTLGLFSAAITSEFQNKYDINLSNKNGKVQFKFINKDSLSASLSIKTATPIGHLEELIESKNGKGNFTLDPFNAALTLSMMQNSEQSFYFDVDAEQTEEMLGYLFSPQKWSEALTKNLNHPEYNDNRIQDAKLELNITGHLGGKFSLTAGADKKGALPFGQVNLGLNLNASINGALEIKDEYSLSICDEYSKLSENLSVYGNASAEAGFSNNKPLTIDFLDGEQQGKLDFSDDLSAFGADGGSGHPMNEDGGQYSPELMQAFQRMTIPSTRSSSVNSDMPDSFTPSRKSTASGRSQKSSSISSAGGVSAGWGSTKKDFAQSATESHLTEEQIRQLGVDLSTLLGTDSHLDIAIDDEVDIGIKKSAILELRKQGLASARAYILQLIAHASSKSEQLTLQALLESRDNIAKCPQSSIEITNKMDRLLILLAKAIDKEELSSHQTIAGDQIGSIIISKNAHITWYQKIADALRQIFSMPTKYTQTLDQFLEPYSAGKMMLNNIKASSKSQTHDSLLGRSSAITATVKYSLDKEQLFAISNTFVQDTAKAIEQSPSKDMLLSIIDKLEQSLSCRPHTEGNLYRLNAVEFQRDSIFKRTPPSFIPHLTLQLNSSLKLTECLGQMVFTYDRADDGHKDILPTDILNKTQGSLSSVIHPSRARLNYV